MPRSNPGDETIRRLKKTAGDHALSIDERVDAMERLLVEAQRRDDAELLKWVDDVTWAAFIRRSGEGLLGHDPSWTHPQEIRSRLREIGLRAWEHRVGRSRRGLRVGAAGDEWPALPIAGPHPDAPKTNPGCGPRRCSIRQNRWQLQVLENGADGVASPAQIEGFKRWHGKKPSGGMKEWVTGGDKSYEIELIYCGTSPAVSWTCVTTCEGCKDHELEVEKDFARWRGHRVLFSGSAMPTVAKDVNGVAYLVGGDLARLERHMRGHVLGPAPVVEYVVMGVRGSSKGPYHYVHRFPSGFEPTLVRDEEVGGFKFEGGTYNADDWFNN